MIRGKPHVYWLGCIAYETISGQYYVADGCDFHGKCCEWNFEEKYFMCRKYYALNDVGLHTQDHFNSVQFEKKNLTILRYANVFVQLLCV